MNKFFLAWLFAEKGERDHGSPLASRDSPWCTKKPKMPCWVYERFILIMTFPEPVKINSYGCSKIPCFSPPVCLQPLQSYQIYLCVSLQNPWYTLAPYGIFLPAWVFHFFCFKQNILNKKGYCFAPWMQSLLKDNYVLLALFEICRFSHLIFSHVSLLFCYTWQFFGKY